REKRIIAGKKTRKRAASIREGCKAMLEVIRRGDERWVVTKLMKEHNHELGMPSRVHYIATEGDAVMDPYIGMEFESLELAKTFYYAYASRVGFEARVRQSRRSLHDESLKMLKLVCSKHRYHSGRDNGSDDIKRVQIQDPSKEGCDALFEIIRKDAGIWMVSKLVLEHNHELKPSLPSKRRRRRRLVHGALLRLPAAEPRTPPEDGLDGVLGATVQAPFLLRFPRQALPPLSIFLSSVRNISSVLCSQTSIEATLASEILLTCDEAVIAAAAAEAVALARAALELAKDAAQMIGKNLSAEVEKLEESRSEADIKWLERVSLTETEWAGITNHPAATETIPLDYNVSLDQSASTDISSSTFDEPEFQEMQHIENIAVRSGRQIERKARRARAADKATADVISLKSGSSGKKKRSAFQEIDYSDPLRYLRGTTNTSKLLTAAEEIELSEGIQVQTNALEVSSCLLLQMS
ncbi:hypothetical protein GW17_00055392, partial [Ensete ventricosum]